MYKSLVVGNVRRAGTAAPIQEPRDLSPWLSGDIRIDISRAFSFIGYFQKQQKATYGGMFPKKLLTIITY